jgi:hypothetical protein
MQVVGQVNRIAVKRGEPGNGWPLALAPASLGIGLRAVALYQPAASGRDEPALRLLRLPPRCGETRSDLSFAAPNETGPPSRPDSRVRLAQSI